MSRIAAAAAVAALLLAGLSPGARADEQPLSLADALELAGRRNPDLGAARERASAQASRAGAARRLAAPRMSLATSWTRTDNPSMVFAHKLNSAEFTAEDFAIERLNAPDALSHQTTVLSLELPVDAFGKIRAGAEAQSAAGAAADAAARQALQDLRLRVVEAYRRAALAQRALDVTARAVAGARAREADIQARVDEGAALTADVLRARARRRRREAELAGARSDAPVALAALARLLGAEPGSAYRLTDEPGAPPPLEGEEEDWVRRALERRAGIETARQREEAARWALQAERRTGLPDVALWGLLQDDRSSPGHANQTGAFGVGVRWSAFDAARAKRVAAAQAESRAAELDTRAARDQARFEAQAAWRRAQSARERYAAAAGGAEESREALRIVQERRTAGMATLTDELETEAASLAAELEESRAAAEAALADAALRHAAGEP